MREAVKVTTEKSSRRLLSVAAVAKLLGISLPGVRRLIRSGQLPTVEVGDAVRIPLPAIDRLVNAGPSPADEASGVPTQVDVLVYLDELRVTQVQLLKEIQSLREEVASLAKEREQKPSDEALLTTKHVAEFLRVSRSVVYGWAEQREGPPFVPMGRSLRFRRRDVLDWLEAKRQEPPGWRVELESRRRAEAGLRRRGAELETERRMADANGLFDNVEVAVILDIPVGTVDGWRFTGRGLAGPVSEGWFAIAPTMFEPGFSRNVSSRPSEPTGGSGGLTAMPRLRGWETRRTR